jgi:hypothetical protein
MSHECILTTRFLRCTKAYAEQGGPALFELDLDYDFEDALLRAAASSPDSVVSSLRAFYALEDMCRLLWLKSYSGSFGKAAGSPKFERSTAGLQQLNATLTELTDSMELQLVSAQLNSKVDWGLSSMYANTVATWVKLLPIVRRCSFCLRAYLRNPALRPWSRVGKYLAVAYTTLSVDPAECIKCANTLLTINRKNVLYPWNTQVNYPV